MSNYSYFYSASSFKKLRTATDKSELTVPAILAMFFNGILGGIFMLLVSDSELAENSNKIISSKAQEVEVEVEPAE
ncbi:hypothetical protein [Mycoplasmopsis agassizii]|uniref:hypothetical protein n=1 Tax=Mycoplasmopsis agassizii TaxID=33922 RepID=UPI0009D8EE91|nr:hypothetical protein [Mycoplasmopsis agassizii]SMC16195.1 hypothetical protein SAMN02745179_00242 [Mycoplasmopsis agassizii]